jgi:hypothetical protein
MGLEGWALTGARIRYKVIDCRLKMEVEAEIGRVERMIRF